MTSPIQSVPLNSSTIPLQLTIDNKIVTWQIIMDLEVKSYVIGTRESAIWADEITGDPLLMMQLSTFQYCKVSTLHYFQAKYHQKDCVTVGVN